MAAGAYVPQIWHLAHEHCSAGISRLAFVIWLVSSALIASHALAIGAGVFIVLGVVQVGATALIVVFATRYEHSFCAAHAPLRIEMAPPSSHPGVVVSGEVRKI